MSQPLAKELEKYEKRLELLDRRAEELADSKKEQYLAAKSQFVSRLRAWKSNVESDIKTLRHNLEEGYYELESKLM